jgi:hypothetical protein
MGAFDHVAADQFDEYWVGHGVLALLSWRGKCPDAGRGFSKIVNEPSRDIFTTEGASQTGPN